MALTVNIWDIMSFQGESWQMIMLACRSGVACYRPPQAEAEQITSAEEFYNMTSTTVSTEEEATCGTDFTYPYFISFYFLCSFLVSLT